MEEEEKQASSPQRSSLLSSSSSLLSSSSSVYQQMDLACATKNNSSFLLGFRMMSFGYILSTCRMSASNAHGLGLLTARPQVTLFCEARTAFFPPSPEAWCSRWKPWGVCRARGTDMKFHKDTWGRTRYHWQDTEIYRNKPASQPWRSSLWFLLWVGASFGLVRGDISWSSLPRNPARANTWKRKIYSKIRRKCFFLWW